MMNQDYTDKLLKIEAELDRWLPENPGPEWIEQMFTYIGKQASIESIRFLISPLRDLLLRGGKRWRPLLMTLVCEILNGGDAAVQLSPVVEFSHNASLIHDDIEDDSDTRRGKPAIHKIFGVDCAINSGSFLYFLASCCIESCSLDNKVQIFKCWMDCMRRLHLGQAMDISWHQNISFVPSIDDYYLMCKLKSGSLARLSTELGALAANTPPEAIQSFGEVADMMGVGFQVMDDVKNLKTGAPGKKKGDDIVEGKKGLPVLLYLQKYPEKRDLIFYYFHAAKTEGIRAPEVEDLINALTVTGVLNEAEEIGRSILKKTRESLNSREYSGISINENYNDLLDRFFNLIS